MVAGNVTFPIYNSDGTSFNGLELKKSVYESVVMSLGDKITGDVYYPNNALVVTMKEYITYNGVKYVLVNPPTIVREGMVSDNGELKGMTKYSFTFYHPMYMLGNFPLCDVAVSSDQQRYLSENKTFFWIGNLTDFVAKLNKNLENTEWYCVINDSVSQADRQRLSEVMSFDKNTIADALKTGYETWDVPYIISIIPSTDPLYQQGKRFLIQYGLPSTEILVENAQHELVPFVFHFGQGVGLKNNSRTPRNNKIVTRIAGYGSEDNIQYGYPQIPYEGGDCQYPLYYGIVGGQRVQLIKHPFTRTHLMPSIYRETVNKKVNPMATSYDPTIELKDYYDADNTYENPIKPLEPSYEIHEFEKIKPELGQRSIVGVSAYSDKDLDSISLSSFISLLSEYYTESEYLKEKEELEKIINTIGTMSSNSGSVNTRAYYCDWSFTKDERYAYVKFESSALNFEYTVLMVSPSQDVEWDDTMDDDGNYVQSYFRITIPQLSFDLYASAAITQEMTINMRSGACLGCSFPVMVDWDDYKLNFYDSDGNFAPNGSQRDYDKYPDSSQGQITLILQKETSTFGTLMPNIYQKPHVGDEFVILGISLPTSYITSAEARLDAEMKQYMRDNNVYYYDYPLKFDEHFLTTHAGILAQMDNNVIVRFDYAGTEHALYIKQVSVKYENKPLPTYDITLTDNIEVVLNQIGQVVDEVRRLHDNLGGVEVQPSNNYLRKDIDDTAYGMIRLIKGLQVGNRFVTGLLGEGGVFRKEEDGTTYLECDKMYVRMKAYFDTVEVRHYMHSAGNRVTSNAGINCSRVEYIDSNGDVTQDVSEATLFRCYFRANDDGREVRNDFVVGDLAFCRETNVNTDSVDQHGYWRAIVGRNANGVLTDDGEGWIDLSVSDCQEGSGIPIAQDDIVQLGNKTDTTRQGAIIEFVSGADAPSYQIYQGINTYSLNGKNYIGLGYSSQNARAYLNVYGDAYIGDPNESSYIRYNAGTRNLEIKAKISAQSTIDGETLAQFIAENTWTEEQIDALITAETDPLSDAIEDIKRQVDGNITTWFYDGVPTLSNLPASEWDTADEKNKHLGDLYYDNITGYGYRFKYDELNRQWSWIRITDVDVTKALADAAKAQDTADHKRRVFVVQPTPPYDAGDLWVNATYPTGNTETNEAQSKYYNDVLRCKTSKASGTTFAIADWSLASKYTDDQALEDFKANQYVTALTNGTINQNITNALNAANAAQQAADDAQDDADAAATAAANAQTSATNANNRLDGWADDGKISPTEKTSLKLEWENVKKEYAQICNDADKYGVSKTAFASAYTSANSAFQKYTAATPENITIGTDYANIAAYYAARQTILDAITTAAKKVATDAQAKADSAYALAGSAEAAAQAAEAHAATLDYVKTALKQDTVIEGGLVLSTLIALRDGSNHIWSGISGTYQSAETGTGYKGHGIAAWYGGAMVDKEVTTTATDYAKSLFRFDGSGYVASGNLSWDKKGNVTIQGYSINATTLQVGGSNVATQAALADYVTLATDQTISGHKTFGTGNGSYIQIGAIRIVYDSTNNALKIVASNGSGSANLYATGGITALGNGSGGSSGGIDMNTVWTALGNATTEQINATHLSNALSAYNQTSNFKTINGSSIIGTGNIEVGAAGDYLPLSGGTVTGNINYKLNFDLSKSDNGVSSTIYLTTFNILDSSGRISARLENVVKANGENGFFLYARQYDANGNMTKQEGLQYHLPKTGDGVWNISNPSSFRTALGLGARATDNTDYLPLTGGTLTGAVATNGGITPLDAGNVNTRAGNGKIFFKTASMPDDGTPHNGIVIEYGKSNTWGGQLLFTDTNNQGLYWNGWSNGVRGEWKRFAFSSDLSSYLPLSGGTMSNTNLVTNLNADLLDGFHSSSFVLQYPLPVKDGGQKYWHRIGNYSNANNKALVITCYAGDGWNTSADQNEIIQIFLKKGYQSTPSATNSIGCQVFRYNWNRLGENGVDVVIVATSDTAGSVWLCQDRGYVSGRYTISGNWTWEHNNSSSDDTQTKPTSNNSGVDIKLMASTTDNVASATKLQTSRSIWGQSFDGTSDVSGKISNASGISLNQTGTGYAWIDFHYGSSSTYTSNIFEQASGRLVINSVLNVIRGGNVGIGTTTPSYKLDVNGTFYASGNSSIGGTLGVTGATTISSTLGVSGLITASGGVTIPSGKTLTIGDAVLSWDSTNQGIKITKGLYSQTFISALGQGSSGESGVNMNTVWTALGNNTNEQINASHLSTALLPYATQTWVTQQIAASATGGTVTAVKVGTTTYNPTSGIVSLPDYLPLSGGTVTGNVNFKGNFDLSKSDNGVSSTIWPTTFNIVDSSSRISARLENIIKANGENSFFLYARQYDANGNMTKQEGLQYLLPKTGDGVWSVSNPSSFRTALGLGARATDNTDYLPLTGGIMTGDIHRDINSLERGVTPSNNTYAAYDFRDKNKKRLAQLEYASESNGRNCLHLYVLTNTNSSVADEYGGLRIFKSQGVSGNVNMYYNANTGVLSGLNNLLFNNNAREAGIYVTADNIDLGWHYANRHGAMMYFRGSTSSDSGSFGIIARNSNASVPLVGKIDGTLTWDGKTIYHAGNVNELYNSFVTNVNATNQNVDYIRIATISLPSSGLTSGGFTAIMSPQQFPEKRSHLLRCFVRRESSGSVSYELIVTPFGTELPPNAYIRTSDNITFYVYIKKVPNAWRDYYAISPLWSDKTTFERVASSSMTGDSGIDSSLGGMAAKLATARTLWGQNFDGSGNVDGTPTINTTTDYGVKVFRNASKRTVYSVGKAASKFNLGYFGFHHVTDDSNTNYVTLGLYGADELVNILGNGNVGIGTTTPAYKLDVSGDVSATNFRGNFVGNADSATKLQTARTIWGQSFDGSADISGAISGATTISASSNVSVGGNLTVTGNVGVGTTSPSYALDVVGSSRTKFLYFYNRANNANAGYIGAGSATVDYIYFQAYENNGLYIGANNGFDFVILPNHNVGVGTTSPSYKMHVSGVAYASAGVYSGGYVTALSDIRHKDVKGNVNLTVSEVANAPSVKFLWKDRRQEGMQVGSIAQYWKKVMPEAIVENADGELTMSYGVIAMLSAISIARKVEDHERRIAELERENKLLKEQLNVA